jgi:hypothetical protein
MSIAAIAHTYPFLLIYQPQQQHRYFTTISPKFHQPIHIQTYHLSTTAQNPSKCLQRVPPLRRSLPLLRPQPRLLSRRRMLERRPLPPETRRSVQRPARRHTLHTFTKVRLHNNELMKYAWRVMVALQTRLSNDTAYSIVGWSPSRVLNFQFSIWHSNIEHSPQASPPRYRYLQPCHVYLELLRQR